VHNDSKRLAAQISKNVDSDVIRIMLKSFVRVIIVIIVIIVTLSYSTVVYVPGTHTVDLTWHLENNPDIEILLSPLRSFLRAHNSTIHWHVPMSCDIPMTRYCRARRVSRSSQRSEFEGEQTTENATSLLL
jgi:hypothetical protein